MNTEVKLEKTLLSIEDSIHEWQHRVRTKKGEPNFRAIPYLAKVCNVTTNTFYNKLQGEKNGNKLSMDDFVQIIVSTEDLELLNVLKEDIIQRIKIK